MTTERHVHTDRCWWNLEQAQWVCRPASTPDTDPAEPERPVVDVRDMIVVHTAMLREFRLLPGAIERTTPGDKARAVTVADHLRFVCELLHHHHSGEDAMLWPLLRERVPADAVRLVDDGEAQHADIDAALDDAHALRYAWIDRPDASNRDLLAEQLRKVHALLRDHLEFEERVLLPLAAAVLTLAEWRALGEAAVAATPKKVLPLVFGMFAYEGDPDVLRSMLQSAPPVPRTLLPHLAPRSYTRRARKVYCTPRP